MTGADAGGCREESMADLVLSGARLAERSRAGRFVVK